MDKLLNNNGHGYRNNIDMFSGKNHFTITSFETNIHCSGFKNILETILQNGNWIDIINKTLFDKTSSGDFSVYEKSERC